MGFPFFGIQEAEKKSLKFKRSLFVVEGIKSGESFSIHNLQSNRPAFGLHARHFETINGKISKMDKPKGTPLS